MGRAGIYHFTTQIVFGLFIVGIGITTRFHLQNRRHPLSRGHQAYVSKASLILKR
jgi:hypothetical protein